MTNKLTGWLARVLPWLKLRRRHVIYGLLIVALLLVSSVSLLRVSPYRYSGNTSGFFYVRGKVLTVQTSQDPEAGTVQQVRVLLLDGPQADTQTTTTRNASFGDQAAKRLPVGSEVLLYHDANTGKNYSFISRWYMPGMATLLIVLLVLVVLIGAWRGITSVFGLSISICILAAYVVPRIVHGHNAFVTCIEAAVAITLISVYIAHGFSKRTTVALAGSLITLGLIVGLTGFASYVTGTSEVIDENSLGVLYTRQPIDIAGLLTGGVIIASLGALFDITTGQAATVDEIHKADPRQSTARLFWKGISVGREHIAALINTLALVYVGSALPAIVTTIVLNAENNYHAPLVVNLNTETIAEELVRTAVASIGMLLALPVTTWLAAYILPRWTPSVSKKILQRLSDF